MVQRYGRISIKITFSFFFEYSTLSYKSTITQIHVRNFLSLNKPNEHGGLNGFWF